MGTQLPLLKKGGGAPNFFGPCLLWPNGWMDQDGTWHGGGSWSRPHGATWGPSSHPQRRGHSPQFSAHFYCGQTAGCIKMPLGIEVGLSLGDVYCGQTAAWIKMPLGTQVGLGPTRHCVRWGPSYLQKKAHPLPIFGPCLWPRSPMSATAELFLLLPILFRLPGTRS